MNTIEGENECYRASINGLLDENKRLKKVLLGLFKMRNEEKVSEEIIKEINIMYRIISLGQEE